MGDRSRLDLPAILENMRRLGLVALALLCLAGCTQQPAGGAFSDKPTPSLTPQPPPRIDLEALRMLRARVAASLTGHVAGGDLAPTWGSGVAASLAGPYREDAAAADAVGLLAARSLARHPSGGAGDGLAGQARLLATSTTAAFRQLDGPQGGAYLLLAKVSPTPKTGPSATDAAQPCPTAAVGGADRPECLRKQVADGLLAAWYASDTKMFLHLGDTTTVYRPVEAISVGAALVVAGYSGTTRVRSGQFQHHLGRDEARLDPTTASHTGSSTSPRRAPTTSPTATPGWQTRPASPRPCWPPSTPPASSSISRTLAPCSNR